jgi:hypothetical protein
VSHADTLGDVLEAALMETDTSSGETFKEKQQIVWRAFAHELVNQFRPVVPLVFACRDVHATSILYLLPGSVTTGAGVSSNEQSIVAPSDGEIRALTARHGNAGSATEDIRYRVRINGSNADLFVDLETGSVNQGSDTATIAFSAGDRLSIISSPFGTLSNTFFQTTATIWAVFDATS